MKTPHGLNGALPSRMFGGYGSTRFDPITDEQLDAPGLGVIDTKPVYCRPDIRLGPVDPNFSFGLLSEEDEP